MRELTLVSNAPGRYGIQSRSNIHTLELLEEKFCRIWYVQLRAGRLVLARPTLESLLFLRKTRNEWMRIL